MPLLEAPNQVDPTSDTDLADVDQSALQTAVGPSGTVAQIQAAVQSDSISTYTVRDTDTSLSQIADMFGVSVDTIVWANDLKLDSKGNPIIHTGDQLVILPVSGVEYTVQKGDTLEKIAKKFNASSDDISSFNDLYSGSASSSELSVGMSIIIPNGEVSSPSSGSGSSKSSSSKSSSKGNSGSSSKSSSGISGYLAWPVNETEVRKTQGLHGKYDTAVDLASLGEAKLPIYAAASGVVIIAKDSGWNGGYGNYIVIQHPNGLQTLYAHLSEIGVSVGGQVSQGDPIGIMGETGNATGVHLHFELWGSVNGWKVRDWNPFN